MVIFQVVWLCSIGCMSEEHTAFIIRAEVRKECWDVEGLHRHKWWIRPHRLDSQIHKMKRGDGAIHIPPWKVFGFLWCIKDDLALKTPSVYSISSKCDNIYIGQTGHSIETSFNHYGIGKDDLTPVLLTYWPDLTPRLTV